MFGTMEPMEPRKETEGKRVTRARVEYGDTPLPDTNWWLAPFGGGGA